MTHKNMRITRIDHAETRTKNTPYNQNKMRVQPLQPSQHVVLYKVTEAIVRRKELLVQRLTTKSGKAAKLRLD